VRPWRISNFANLNGTGGIANSARWHSRGRAIVYMAESPPGALLERLVHLEIDPKDLPSNYQLLAVDVPDDLAFETVDQQILPVDWRYNDSATQKIGDDWLQAGRTALLRVPSAITPHTFNWLLNPAHEEAAAARIVEVISAPFDLRLFR
jgi:RES domain-containing protein